MRIGIMGRVMVAAGALLFGALAPSCGGGGGGGTTGGIVATFTPASPNPAALSVTMQTGSASGQNFNVRISATDVNDFFGAAFTINLPTGISFVSLDSAQSFLRDGGFPIGNLSFLSDTSTPTKLRVVATRLNAGTNSGVNVVGTRELVTLRFSATRAFAATPLEFLTATDTCEVRGSVQPPPEGNLIDVSWSGGSVVATQQ